MRTALRRIRDRVRPGPAPLVDPALLGDAFLSAPPTDDVRSPAGAPRPFRLVVAGDSTAKPIGLALQSYGADSDDMSVWVVSGRAATVHQGSHMILQHGWEVPPASPDMIGVAISLATRVGADAIMILVGSGSVGLWRHDDLDALLGVDDPEVERRYRNGLGDAIDRLRDVGIPTFWGDHALLAWTPKFWEERKGEASTGEGACTLNDPDRWKIVDAIDRELLGPAPHIDHWPLMDTLVDADGTVPTTLRPDGAHLALGPARELAEERWVPMLRRSYRSLTDPGERGNHTWSAS